jgi:catechol 2,3-dioxygenase-like lactoylglutathione lyase family enzyme
MDLRWDAVTVDCRDPQELARFWCALLGVEVRGTWEQYVGLTPAAPGLPRLVFQRTSDPRPAKNTLHLDLHVPADDLPAAVEHALGLGATLVHQHDEDAVTWRTLADPEGNVFCLVAD